LKAGPTTPEGKNRIAELRKAEWARPDSVYRTPEYRQKQRSSHEGKTTSLNRRCCMTQEQLIDLYWNQGLGQREIAEILGFSPILVSRRMKELGIPARETNGCGKNNGNFKGGKTVSPSGYVYIRIPEHSRAKSNGYVAEHILVWEQTHHRTLPAGWVVHHLNGVKSDNRSENLVARPRGQHISQAEPYRKRIRQLEVENEVLKTTLEQQQLIFLVSNNNKGERND
jgi:hypothetical protein